MRVGVLVEGQEGLTWERWRRIVRAVDDLGFDALWRSDHFVSIVDPSRAALEVWVALAVGAAESRRVTLGSLVCPMTFRPPAVLAKMAADVDALSGGRLVLGVGAGWNDVEHHAYGLAFPGVAERMDRLEEGIEVIRRIWGEGPPHFAGHYYQLDGPDLPGRPAARRIPLLIGGAGERRTLRTVARYADVWDIPGGISVETYRLKNERLAEYCRQVGRDPAAIERSVSTAFLIGRDDAEIDRRVVAMRQYIPSLAGLDQAAAVAVLRTFNWQIGTPDELAEYITAWAAEGVDRVNLQLNDYDDLAALELVAKEVLPRV